MKLFWQELKTPEVDFWEMNSCNVIKTLNEVNKVKEEKIDAEEKQEIWLGSLLKMKDSIEISHKTAK